MYNLVYLIWEPRAVAMARQIQFDIVECAIKIDMQLVLA